MTFTTKKVLLTILDIVIVLIAGYWVLWLTFYFTATIDGPILRQHRTTTGYRLCRTSACRFSVILLKTSLKYDSIPASVLSNLTKNLTTHLYDNGCAVLP